MIRSGDDRTSAPSSAPISPRSAHPDNEDEDDYGVGEGGEARGRHTFGVRSGMKIKGSKHHSTRLSKTGSSASSTDENGESHPKKSPKKKRDLQRDILAQLGQLTHRRQMSTKRGLHLLRENPSSQLSGGLAGAREKSGQSDGFFH